MAEALSVGRAALVLIAFVSVAREGIETSLFLWSTTQSSGGRSPLLWAVLGLGTAAVLGYLLYRSAISINLAKFFRYTGIGLIVIAAGVLAYGLHNLQEAGWIPGLNSVVFDASRQVPLSSWYGTLLKGVFNWNPQPTYIELAAWIAYLVTTLTLFLWPTALGKLAAAPKAAAPSNA